MCTFVAQHQQKPLAELDQSPYFSPEHPHGNLLQRLLDAGAHADRANRGKKRGHASGSNASGSTSRFRTADLYELVGRTGIRTSTELLAYACEAATNGDRRFAEYCTVVGSVLQNNLDAAWAVHDAPSRLASMVPDRIARLRQAAQGTCTCDGVWVPGALKIINNNGDTATQFGHDVFRALAIGARRGVNMAIIGPPGIGKSMLFDSLDEVFAVMGKPQRDCSYPLAGVLDADVLLWQEFAWSPKVCAWDDLLNLMCGEKLGIRVPHAKPVQHRNKSPMFYTARQPLTMNCLDPIAMLEYNQAMTERFNIRVWSKTLPCEERHLAFPRCGACFSKFVLEHEQIHQMFSQALEQGSDVQHPLGRVVAADRGPATQ